MLQHSQMHHKTNPFHSDLMMMPISCCTGRGSVSGVRRCGVRISGRVQSECAALTNEWAHIYQWAGSRSSVLDWGVLPPPSGQNNCSILLPLEPAWGPPHASECRDHRDKKKWSKTLSPKKKSCGSLLCKPLCIISKDLMQMYKLSLELEKIYNISIAVISMCQVQTFVWFGLWYFYLACSPFNFSHLVSILKFLWFKEKEKEKSLNLPCIVFQLRCQWKKTSFLKY